MDAPSVQPFHQPHDRYALARPQSAALRATTVKQRTAQLSTKHNHTSQSSGASRSQRSQHCDQQCVTNCIGDTSRTPQNLWTTPHKQDDCPLHTLKCRTTPVLSRQHQARASYILSPHAGYAANTLTLRNDQPGVCLNTPSGGIYISSFLRCHSFCF